MLIMIDVKPFMISFDWVCQVFWQLLEAIT